MSPSDGPREAASGRAPSSQQERDTLLVGVLQTAVQARSRLIWFLVASSGITTIAMMVGLVRGLAPGGLRLPAYAGIGSFSAVAVASCVAAMVEERAGFQPRYSRIVARQSSISMVEAARSSGVVVVEARVLVGAPDGPLFRPPLVLEDRAGSRLYAAVLEEVRAMREMGDGGRNGPLLGDQTNGILYQPGEDVVFVGRVRGHAASAPTYREGKALGINAFAADLAWLVFKGATREEVVKMLQEREMSPIPIRVCVLLGIVGLALSLLAFLGR